MGWGWVGWDGVGWDGMGWGGVWWGGVGRDTYAALHMQATQAMLGMEWGNVVGPISEINVTSGIVEFRVAEFCLQV